jgi:uncharacterized protein YhfF
MPIPPQHQSFWLAFAQGQRADPTPRFLESFFFGDREDMANELAALVLQGRKRATTALLWSHEAAGTPLPARGQLSIVTDFAGTPLCVIETVTVEVLPFEDVGAEFAAAEGEGDGSLAYWQSAHQAYVARECQRIGRTPEPRMPVVCERFEVVYRAPGRSGA